MLLYHSHVRIADDHGDANFVFFFFQAEDGIRDLTVTGVQTCSLFNEEDGIRDLTVTGVQTCALPISPLLTLMVSAKPWILGSPTSVPMSHALGGVPGREFSNGIGFVAAWQAGGCAAFATDRKSVV